MTKEKPRTVRTYRVWVDYAAGGTEQTSTVWTLEAGSRVEAHTTGLRLFEEWVAYNREHGYGDFTGLEITRVRCRFVDCRTV